MASEGEVRIVVAEPVHRDGVLAVARDAFVKGEPMRKAMGTKWEEVEGDWEKMVDECLRVPHSHIAVDGQNRVVGIRLSRIINLQNYSPDQSINEFMRAGHVRRVADQVTKDWAAVLVDEKGKTCKMVLQFLSLSVLAEYGGRGIGQRLCQENMKMGEKLGCEYCAVEASNWMSQRIFDKLRFTTAASFAFDDFRDENGRKLFQINDAKQIGSKFHVKKLKSQ